jgi:hypothetical protein
LRPAFEELPDGNELSSIFPFQDEQIERIARTEPTLRDMLQQFRHLFDYAVFGTSPASVVEREAAPAMRASPIVEAELPPVVKSVMMVEAPSAGPEAGQRKVAEPVRPTEAPRTRTRLSSAVQDSWEQEIAAARAQLEPEGALTGATRELQAGLGAFLQICHEHGVKVGPWRLQHVVPEWTFGDHPTYGAISLGHWVCREGQPWKVGVGLFLGRSVAKPKDLATKLAAFDAEPPVIDHLILLRPADDLALSGKSKTLWHDSEKKGRHARLEAVPLESFAVLYAFPRWLSALTESCPAGQSLPNLADLLQERCEKLLEQVCMPVQG